MRAYDLEGWADDDEAVFGFFLTSRDNVLQLLLGRFKTAEDRRFAYVFFVDGKSNAI